MKKISRRFNKNYSRILRKIFYIFFKYASHQDILISREEFNVYEGGYMKGGGGSIRTAVLMILDPSLQHKGNYKRVNDQ